MIDSLETGRGSSHSGESKIRIIPIRMHLTGTRKTGRDGDRNCYRNVKKLKRKNWKSCRKRQTRMLILPPTRVPSPQPM